MANIRIIGAVKNGGEQEYVIFTEDFEIPAEDHLRPGYEITTDEIRDLDLPDGFPLEYMLVRD